MHGYQQAASKDLLLHWLAPFGRSARLALGLLAPRVSDFSLTWADFKSQCWWMGIKSIPLVTLSAAFVGIALTMATVLELLRYGAVDMSGSVITPLLLRELGPLTISLAWSARVAARLAVEAQAYSGEPSDIVFAQKFISIRLLAGLIMAVPLSAFGLVVGYSASALFATTIGVSSLSDFLESSRMAVTNRDVAVYMIKLILVNPTIAVFCGSLFGRLCDGTDTAVAPSRAVTAVFLAGYFANTLFSLSVYLP